MLEPWIFSPLSHRTFLCLWPRLCPPVVAEVAELVEVALVVVPVPVPVAAVPELVPVVVLLLPLPLPLLLPPPPLLLLLLLLVAVIPKMPTDARTPGV